MGAWRFFLKASLIGKTAIKQLQGGLKALEHAKLSHVHYRENIHNIIFFKFPPISELEHIFPAGWNA